jgi:hypothetical protein
MNWQTFETSLSFKGKPVAPKLTINRKDVVLPAAFEAHDLWNKKTVAADKNYTAKIAPHDVVLFRVIKKQ